MQYTITSKEIKAMETEWYFYNAGNSGRFTTLLFDALKVADMGNFRRLAKAFPVHGYMVAKNHSEHFLKYFNVVDDES